MIGIVAINQAHCQHICGQYRIQPDRVKYIRHIDDLNAFLASDADAVVMFGDQWQRTKPVEVALAMDRLMEDFEYQRRERIEAEKEDKK